MKTILLINIFFGLTTLTALAETGSADSKTDDKKQVAWISTQAEKKDIPQAILNLDPRTQKLSANQRYEITIGFVDDNKWVSDTSGDDRGYTYGHFLQASAITEHGIRLTFSYSGDLYTQDNNKCRKDSEGKTFCYQNAVEESVVKFVVDNAEQGKLMYYRAGAGWHLLDEGGSGPAATAQIKFHSLIKELRQPVNIRSKYKESAALAELTLGLQKKQQISSKIALEERAEAGVRYSGIPDASYVMADASVALSEKTNFIPGLSTKLTAGLNVKSYDIGTEISPYTGIAITYKNWGTCGIQVSQTQGTLANYQKYNVVNRRTGEIDSQWTASCQRRFKN